MNRYPLAALACAALIAGCGDDDKSSEPLSKAELTAQADKICRDANSRAEAVEQPAGPAGLDRYVDETKPILEDLRDELRGLEDRAPNDISAGFSEFVDLIDQTIVKFGEFKDVGTDRAKIAAVGKELDSLEAQTDALADKTGFKGCAG